jgi:two-component system phosphate regulon response regulator PhoB
MVVASATILVVEDEEPLQELLGYNLKQAGYRLLAARAGKEAIELATREGPSLILLDLMLPDMDGLAVCKTLKERPATSGIPVIMVTAKGEESDIVLGLEMGAEDYVTKPFNLAVLLARIRVALRRHGEPEPDEASPLRVGAITLHPGRREVRVKDEAVELTETQFSILRVLMGRPGWVFTRGQIVDRVRSKDYAVTDRSVDVQIVGLRRKLGNASSLIETVRGVGYRFRAD